MPHDTSRRRFLASLSEAGACLAAGSWLDVIGYAQAGRGSARAVIEPLRASGAFDRRLLGSFLEHLGRAIYTGVYQPGSRSGGRQRLPHRCGPRDQEPGRAHHPISRRQFRVRLQLAGRRRSEGAAADGPRPRLEFARDESVRHERVHRLVPASSAPSRCSG